MIISPQFIDVDFNAEAEASGKMTGCNPQTPDEIHRLFAAPRFNANELIPESKWEARCAAMEFYLRESVRTILDQGQEGSCTGNAAAGAAMFRGYQLYGAGNWVPLSAMSVYKRIGDSPDSGATMSDTVMATQSEGILPLDGEDYPHTHPATGFYESLPDGWRATAKLWRPRWSRCVTLEETISAVLQGKPCLVGRDGHAIYYSIPVYRDGQLYLGYPNSWGIRWGDPINDRLPGGLGWDSRAKVASTVTYCLDDITCRSEIGLP